MRRSIGVALLITGSVLGLAQQPAAPSPGTSPVQISELERAQLDLKSKDLQIWYLQFQNAQTQVAKLNSDMSQVNANYMQAQKDFETKVEEIKKAHNFGEDVSFNKQTGIFERKLSAATKPGETGKSPSTASENAPAKK
jgi:hypothetical protein